MNFPSIWRMERKDSMPILEISGISFVENTDIYMVQMALQIIKMAEQFKGYPYSQEPNFGQNAMVSVFMAIIFPSQKEVIQFLSYMQNNGHTNP